MERVSVCGVHLFCIVLFCFVLFCAWERKEPVKDGMKVQSKCKVLVLYRVIINKNNKYLVTWNTFITFINIDRRDRVT